MRKNYYIRKILDYLGVTALLSVLVFLWVLYQGPISVPFLKPYITKALNTRQSEYTIDIGEVNIELVRSIQPVKFIAKNVILKKNDDTVSVQTKKLFLSFSIRALLQGLIAPSSILIKNPQVSIFTTYGVEKNKENEVNRKKFEYYADWFNDFLERFYARDKIYPESFINDINIQNASIEFHEVDLGKKWQFTDANLHFNRALTHLNLSASGIVDLEEKMATLSANAKYDFISRNINLGVQFSDVVISDFIPNIGGGISNVDIPIEGDLNAEIDFAKITENPEDLTANIDAAFKKVDFSVKTSGGKIVFENNPHFDYLIDALDFKGEVKGGLDEIRLKKAVLKMQDQTAQLGVSITGYQKYFFEKSLDNLKITLTAKTDRLLMDDLAKFWPKYYAEPAWLWCKENLYGGTYQDADFNFVWAYDKDLKSVELQTLKGLAHIHDGTISYMEEMPKVVNVDGTAKFDIGTIDIALDKGTSNGLEIAKGYVKLYDLNKDNNYIDITIRGQTSIKDALEYINHPPLEFAKDLGIDPNKVLGNVDIDLNLNFELYEDLKSEDIKVKTTAVLRDVVIKNVFEGKDLKASRADLKITEKALNAKGNALFNAIPVQFDYTIDFSQKNNQSKGRFALTYDYQTGQKLGLTDTLLETPYLEGYAFVNADIVSQNQRTEMDINADLTHMALDYSFLGLEKPVDKPGTIHTKLVLKDGRLISVPLFEVKSQDFSIKGDVTLDKKSNIQTINISSIEGKKTSAAAKIEFANTKKQHVKVNISGSSYDLTSLFNSRDEDQKKKTKNESLSNDDDGLETWPDTDIFIAVNSLWTNPNTPIKNFAGSATIKNGIGLDEVHLIGNHGTDKSIKLNVDYIPHINNEHRLTIESNNAGSTLKVLRLYENMSGGNLKIEAKREPNKKFIGHAKIRDFKIYNTPLLTKLLTVASFSGMLDLLKGDGLVFSHFDAPFTYANKVLTISDAKMFGNVIGLTATGYVNRISEDIDIKGVVSPAYGLNSLMGKIPLIGKFLAGKDGTVFAVDYTITDTIDAPNVEIYPLSLLSPNSVKDLFAGESGQ